MCIWASLDLDIEQCIHTVLQQSKEFIWGKGLGRGGEEKLGLFNHDFSIVLEVHYELIIESILRLGFGS